MRSSLCLAVFAIIALSSAAHANVDPKANAAIIQAKNADQNFECCYERAVTEYKTKAKKCVDAIDAAIAAGESSSDVVGSTHKTLAESREWCISGVERVTAKYVVGRLQYFETWEVNVHKPGHGYDDAKEAISEAETCRKEVDDALAAGVPASTTIKLVAGEIALSDAKAKVCDPVAAAGQEIVDAAQAALDAKKAPYRKVLKGDKLNLIENLWGDAFYGVGGEALDTPEKLAHASVWFETLTWVDDNDGKTHWTLRRYAFRGDKAVGNATEQSGCCDEPPTRLYR
jgi:hypothetical protein